MAVLLILEGTPAVTISTSRQEPLQGEYIYCPVLIPSSCWNLDLRSSFSFRHCSLIFSHSSWWRLCRIATSWARLSLSISRSSMRAVSFSFLKLDCVSSSWEVCILFKVRRKASSSRLCSVCSGVKKGFSLPSNEMCSLFHDQFQFWLLNTSKFCLSVLGECFFVARTHKGTLTINCCDEIWMLSVQCKRLSLPAS